MSDRARFRAGAGRAETLAAPLSLPPAEVHALSNGLRAVLRPSRANEVVALKLYLPLGPLYESAEEAGLSNLVQEMLLHGTRRRSEDEVEDLLADLGAKLGTSAAGDYGSVALRATRKELPGALDLLQEVLAEPAFAEDEIAKEKVRILNRIKAQNDSLLTAAFDLFRETFYGSHPYHKPVLGYPDTVRALQPDAVRTGRERLYRAGRLVAGAVGNFDPDDLLRRFEGFGLAGTDGWEAARADGRVTLERTREVARRRESQAAWFVLGFPAPSYRDAQYAPTRLLDAILGGSMNSRLFMELREKRSLAYQVSTHYNDQLGHSYLAGYIGTSPDKFEEARQAMLHEFRRIAEERIPDVELERAKNYLKGAYIISSETNGAQASRLGKYELYGLGQDFGDRLLERIGAVTAEEIRDVAQMWFGEYVLAAIHPDEASLDRLRSEGPPEDVHETTGTENDEEESG
ncbi:MAG: insulinase family protein [Gemmatimonadetes bacterium]|nr:insulinase family protein [Gemmatimonadota bacterium]